MSRIGRAPITVPSGVNIAIADGKISVSGSKGTLETKILSGMTVKQEGDNIIVTRPDDEKLHRSNHGLMRTLIDNMVIGATKGFEKKLEVTGVGYRVNLAGNTVKLSLGFSHEIEYPLPEGVQANVEQNTITISGSDKQKVGQVAAEIRALKKPEPYKGKGIAYAGERILRKSGKSGKEGA